MLKRDLRLFLRCLLWAAVLTAAFAAVSAAAALAAVKNAQEVYIPVKAAVVDGEDSVFSRMLIRAAAKTDHIAELMDITRCSYEEAMAGLASGELSAVIVLPDGVFGDITAGKRSEGQLWLSPAAAAHSELVESAASFGQLLLAAGQYGVFSGERLIARHGLGSAFHSEFLAQTNLLLLNEAMAADKTYFTVTVTDYADTAMSTGGYYASAWLTLLLMLSVLCFFRLYTADLSRSMLSRLQAVGVGTGKFLAGKLLFPMLFQGVILTAASAVVSGFIPLSLTWAAVICALGCILFSAAVGGGLMLGGGKGACAVAVSTLVGFVLCGGIVPRQMLPQALRLVGDLTPFGVARGLLSPMLGGRLEPSTLLAAIVWLGILSAGVSFGLRRVQVGGDGV